MICDFHVHSSASDGDLSPVEVVEAAQRAGVEAMALTDHDDVSGVAEARRRGAELGVRVIPGVELTVSEREGSVQIHVLGLGVDIEHAALLDRLAAIRHARRARAGRILDQLRAAGVDLDLDALLASRAERTIGRLHVAEALVRSGRCASLDDAFARYLRRGRPAYVPSEGVCAREAIDLLHAADGIACLAHPPLSSGVDGPGGLEGFVDRLVSFGLDGIEIQHPGHRPSQVRKLRRLARRHGLIGTGGSDFHGSLKPGIELGRGRGSIAVGRDTYDAILRAIERRRERARRA